MDGRTVSDGWTSEHKSAKSTALRCPWNITYLLQGIDYFDKDFFDLLKFADKGGRLQAEVWSSQAAPPKTRTCWGQLSFLESVGEELDVDFDFDGDQN